MVRRWISAACVSTFILLAGCVEETEPDARMKPTEIKDEQATLFAYQINEAPREALTPAEAILTQFEVKLTKEESVFPTEASIQMESIVGDQAVLVIESPEPAKPYAAFLYTMEDKWRIEGVMSGLSRETENTRVRLSEMSSQEMSLDENERMKKLWVFYDDQIVITVMTMEQSGFAEDSPSDVVTLSNGIEAYVMNQKYGNGLYYFDSGQVVVVSGNVEREHLLEVAGELDSVTSINFP